LFGGIGIYGYCVVLPSITYANFPSIFGDGNGSWEELFKDFPFPPESLKFKWYCLIVLGYHIESTLSMFFKKP
jgi:hypothetical protein